MSDLLPQLAFEHHGIERTLNKHQTVQAALRSLQRNVIAAVAANEITVEESARLIELAQDDARAKPWYLRIKKDSHKLSVKDKDAIRGAKDILNGQRDNPAEFSAWLAERKAKRGVTLSQLAADWTAAGLPDENGRKRPSPAAQRMTHELNSALRWWSDKPAAAAGNHFNEFITWRRATSKRGPGDRAADLEMNAMSCLCQWAVFAKKIEKNPFAERPTFQDKSTVKHCSEFAPESDEAVHRVLTWFWSLRPAPAIEGLKPDEAQERLQRHCIAEQERFVAGGWLACCNLTGLRTGEPYYLSRHPALTKEPHRPDQLAAGTLFPFADGRSMKVYREKRGQNPYVTMHPAAADFLKSWTLWLETNLPLQKGSDIATVQPWFPNPSNLEKPLCPARPKKGKLEPDTSYLNDLLAQACRDLALPHFTPSGFGRAYYTRVRKSQRASNAVIAEELGQTTLGKLVRSTYARRDEMFGSLRYDWLPETDKREPIEPAWKLLTVASATNIIAL